MPEYYWGAQTKYIFRQISDFAVNRAARLMGPSEDEAQTHVVIPSGYIRKKDLQHS